MKEFTCRALFRLAVVALVWSVIVTRPAKGADPETEKARAAVAVAIAKLDVIEKRLGGIEAKLDSIDRALSAKPVKASAPVSAPRAPVGHTHTCANGHTWDHTMDGGSHQCPYPGCGLSQFYQDPSPRAVGGSGQTYSLTGAGSGGCANGSCSAPQRTLFQPFGGVFRRR